MIQGIASYGRWSYRLYYISDGWDMHSRTYTAYALTRSGYGVKIFGHLTSGWLSVLNANSTEYLIISPHTPNNTAYFCVGTGYMRLIKLISRAGILSNGYRQGPKFVRIAHG